MSLLRLLALWGRLWGRLTPQLRKCHFISSPASSFHHRQHLLPMFLLIAKASQIAGRGIRVRMPQLALYNAKLAAFIEQDACM
ncbi:MAG: hypothetical protein FWG59_01410, partial [Betaproteobacteria bacterium]|nr:hypothetical protein [Betaproteobacteria bacterium]